MISLLLVRLLDAANCVPVELYSSRLRLPCVFVKLMPTKSVLVPAAFIEKRYQSCPSAITRFENVCAAVSAPRSRAVEMVSLFSKASSVGGVGDGLGGGGVVVEATLIDIE